MHQRSVFLDMNEVHVHFHVVHIRLRSYGVVQTSEKLVQYFLLFVSVTTGVERLSEVGGHESATSVCDAACQNLPILKSKSLISTIYLCEYPCVVFYKFTHLPLSD